MIPPPMKRHCRQMMDITPRNPLDPFHAQFHVIFSNFFGISFFGPFVSIGFVIACGGTVVEEECSRGGWRGWFVSLDWEGGGFEG